MAVTKTETGWLVDFRPDGRGSKRYRKTFPTKAEALRWAAFIKTKTVKTPDWQPEHKDSRRLNELLQIWYDPTAKP